jgi:hypothetical protein
MQSRSVSLTAQFRLLYPASTALLNVSRARFFPEDAVGTRSIVQHVGIAGPQGDGGLGRNIAEAVLASGDRLVAPARHPRRLEDLVHRSMANRSDVPLVFS